MYISQEALHPARHEVVDRHLTRSKGRFLGAPSQHPHMGERSGNRHAFMQGVLGAIPSVHTAIAAARWTALDDRAVEVCGWRNGELPNIAGLAEQRGRGVVVCPYCDGYEVRDGRIGVLATSAWSVHQARLLRQWSAHVIYLVDRTGGPEGDELRALQVRGIEVEDSPVVRVLSDSGRLTGVEVADGRRITLDAIFTSPSPDPFDGIPGGQPDRLPYVRS